MTVTFFTNYINHHQVPLADELYEILGGQYCYVAMESLPQSFKEAGYPDFSDKPYFHPAYENDKKRKEAEELAWTSDVVIIGSAPQYLVASRLAANKITFQYSERCFKTLNYRLLSPKLWWYLYNTHTKYRNKQAYMLAASAYTANDVSRFFAYPKKCYKWGYFTQIDTIDIDTIVAAKSSVNIDILWCARFLKWKHPELVVKLAQFLKIKGHKFHINMLGSGDELIPSQRLAERLGVAENISFLGNRPNNEVLKMMQTHHIFLFTSDRNEGWGAVLNEAMSNGCPVVASNKVGAVPFLIEDGVNGSIFRSEDIAAFTRKVEELIVNPQLRKQYAINAYHTIKDEWSPRIAAHNFMRLLENIVMGKDTPVEMGPCSKAVFIDSNKIMK